MYEQDCSGINQTDIPPGGGPGESVKALDDVVDITEGNVATDEAGNTESIEEEASIAEEQVPVGDTTDEYTGDNIEEAVKESDI